MNWIREWRTRRETRRKVQQLGLAAMEILERTRTWDNTTCEWIAHEILVRGLGEVTPKGQLYRTADVITCAHYTPKAKLDLP